MKELEPKNFKYRIIQLTGLVSDRRPNRSQIDTNVIGTLCKPLSCTGETKYRDAFSCCHVPNGFLCRAISFCRGN